MRHEKIFDRIDGSKVSITVELYTDTFRNKYRWSFGVATKGFRKRTWFHNKNEAATEEEINSVKVELWNIINPLKAAPNE